MAFGAKGESPGWTSDFRIWTELEVKRHGGLDTDRSEYFTGVDFGIMGHKANALDRSPRADPNG